MHFKRSGQQSTRFRSKASEKKAARVFGGRLQPNSGALKPVGLKGDVKSSRFLVDDKCTDKESFTLKRELWQKLSNQAWSNHLRPALRIDFAKGSPLYVLDEMTFKEMLEKTKRWD